MEEISSLYIHVPFCRKKCIYCDFYSLEGGEKENYLKLILKEFHLNSPQLTQFPTVYFGGGTPSLMGAPFFEGVLSRVGQFSEVSVEVNLEDATIEKLKEYKEVGINRISLGIQSLNDKVLRALKRQNTVKENLKAIENSLSVFSNVSVDFIYGAPEQTTKEFLRELKVITSYPIKHISLYALTLYEGTPLLEKVRKGEIKLPDDEKTSELYYTAVDFLRERGFSQYELSNFAVKGFESRHNISYWKVKNYLGLGPSAASFLKRTYRQNLKDLKVYREKVERGEPPTEIEERYSKKELLELKLLMGLRLTEGIDLEKLKIREAFEELSEREPVNSLLEEGLLVYNRPVLRIGKRGFFTYNAVVGRLIPSLLESENVL